MSGAVVWLTGLPSSGKSTLAARVRELLAAQGQRPVVLDGDEVRAALVPTPGYNPASREAFYTTLAQLAALLARQELIVLVAATAQRRAWRDRARELAPSFVEVYVATDAATCHRRDAKGLYAQAGVLPELPGAGAVYEPPLAPDVIAEAGCDDAAARRIIACLGTHGSGAGGIVASRG